MLGPSEGSQYFSLGAMTAAIGRSANNGMSHGSFVFIPESYPAPSVSKITILACCYLGDILAGVGRARYGAGAALAAIGKVKEHNKEERSLVNRLKYAGKSLRSKRRT